MRMALQLVLLQLGLLVAAAAGGGGELVNGGCRLSEHRCAASQLCIAQDRFCDGENDCQDKSDEPVYCTPCNRTLYGDVGRTYELQVRRPREERLPFLCHLNFTAAGGEFGDLVQLTFDTFTVGRFQSFTSEGCPDGHMSIKEEGRPATGGQWCGSAWGYTVYYSETRSINLTLYLSRLSGQGNDYNFDFKLSYKFLKRSEAHLRYGNSSLSTWRGELVNATYCDRVFTRCDVRACRLQSPNYPGVYPRNVTCYYRLEQKRAPPGHRALLAVSQRNSHKIHIKDQVNKYDTSQRSLRLWDQCNVVQDYLSVYDGGSTQDRVLVRLCGGDSVPDIVGSKDTMLLEFHTSPYDNPFHPVPLSFLPGFELEVQVIFVDERSSGASFVVKDHEKCDFYISSYEGPYGVLENPKHSLPPNTTCRYHFQGKPNEIVWLAFVKYYAAAASASGPATSSGAECNVKLLIWDGQRENATLLGQFCKDEVPRLCDHSLLRNASRRARPCSLAESYVSRGRQLTLEHVLRQGSALYPVSFVVRYEFVAVAPASQTSPNATSCDRRFRGPSSGSFSSPRNVFFYGRGGAANLSCVYSFEPAPEHRLELAIRRASFGQRSCWSWMDPLVNRWTCERPRPETLGTGEADNELEAEVDSEGIAELRLSEYPWPGVQLPRDCLCSNLSERLVLLPLSSAHLELTFTVERMNVTQDYEDFFFEAEYRYVPLANQTPSEQQTKQQQQQQTRQQQTRQQPACHHSSRALGRHSRLEERRLRGTSGEIALRSPPPAAASSRATMAEQLAVLATIDQEEEAAAAAAAAAAANTLSAEVTHCVNEPWLIEPEDSRLHFLYLATPGFRLTRHNVHECPTRNRIVVYPAASPHERTVVCPAPTNRSLDHHQQHEQHQQPHDSRQQSQRSRDQQQRVVDLISGGWNRSSSATRDRAPPQQQQQQHARSFVVEFLQHEPGAYVVSWMAISRRLLGAPSQGFFGSALAPPAQLDCPYRCPELEACISALLWCDGVAHCPSGFDERDDNCSYRLGLTLLYVAVGAAALGLLLVLLLATGGLRYCLYRRARASQRQLKLPPQHLQPQDQQPPQPAPIQHKDKKKKKKKVQVLSVDAPNNGNLEPTPRDALHHHQQQHHQHQQQHQQSFARIGRYPTNSLSRQLHCQQARLRPETLDEDNVC